MLSLLLSLALALNGSFFVAFFLAVYAICCCGSSRCVVVIVVVGVGVAVGVGVVA